MRRRPIPGGAAERTGRSLRAIPLLAALGMACGGPLPVGESPDAGDSPLPEADVPPRDDGGTPDVLPEDGETRTDVPVGPCSGECSAHRYTTCTCASADPCGWAGDGSCDDACNSVLPGSHFDDSTDCAPPPTCSGDCDARRYSACSCGTSDPCRWAGNGVCDRDACGGVPGMDFDDGADCSTPGALTYAVTSVRGDGLDPGDMDVAASALAGLGYTESVRDDAVTFGNLAAYLGRDITTLYHTGHGNDGIVMTTDGYLTVDEVSPGGIRVRNAIFATCLTLVPSWAGAFGPTAESVLGYTDLSYDYVDDEVVRAMVPELRAGRSYIMTWYRANAGFDMLYDRWAGYVRQGASIVEYSARTGRLPTEPLDATWIAFPGADDVFATADVLADERTFDGRFVDVRIGAPGEPETVAAGGFELLGPSATTAVGAEAAARARLEALGWMTPDAVPGAIVAVDARRGGTDPGAVVGWVVRYGREAAGLPVRGNLFGHHIAVLVGPTGVVSASRFWPDLAVVGAPATAPRLLPVADAVRAAAAPLSRAVKGAEIRIVGASPVYGTTGLRAGAGSLVPAYALHTAQGFQVVVDAATGEPLF